LQAARASVRQPTTTATSATTTFHYCGKEFAGELRGRSAAAKAAAAAEAQAAALGTGEKASGSSGGSRALVAHRLSEPMCDEGGKR